MQKQLIAVAIATVFSASSIAANVVLYGNVDLGLGFSQKKDSVRIDFTPLLGWPPYIERTTTNSCVLNSGISTPSMWGIKGTEELGGGYSVSFQLESGFEADSGALNDAGRLFGREARLTLETPFGEFSFGRMGALSSSNGTYDPSLEPAN